MSKTGTTASDRLGRVGEGPERYGKRTERPVENLIVIGASAGGHNALRDVVGGLSSDIPAAIILMQHTARKHVAGLESFKLEEWLRKFTPVPIQTVQSGDRLRPGRIYIPPPGQAVVLNGRVLQLKRRSQDAPVTTINRLFESAARAYNERVIGVVLTGLLKDGTAGLKAVHEAGGLTIVQDPVDAEYPDMPASAMEDLPVTFCLNVTDIGITLDILARRTTALETGLAVSVRMLKDRMAVLVRLLAQSKRNLSTQQFLSTEMRSLKQDLHSTQGLLAQALALAKTGRDNHL